MRFHEAIGVTMQVELQNIAAKASGLYEYEAGKVLIFIPKEEVKKLSISFEKPTRFSALAVIFGVLLIAGGICFGVFPLINAVASHSFNYPVLKGCSLISLHILFGAYLINLGLRKRHCLVLTTSNGTKKLVFKEPVAGQIADEFLHEIFRKFGYPI